ncbi:terminase [Clostridia bacterium]|nr:terminase [Clostridia bacterium]
MDYPALYLVELRSGRIITSEAVRAIYERLDKERGADGQFAFNERSGLHAVEFIESFCRHYEGKQAGKQIILDLWQKAFVQTLFGWIERDTGLRRFREFLLLVARKNGKSMLSACIMVYMLVADGEAGAQCVSIATKYDQASIVYKTARKIIEQDADLRALVKPIVGGMEFKMTNSVMKALASKSKTLDGLNLHYVSCDELHAQEDRNMYDVTRQSMKAREQPIFGSITTAGFAQQGIFESIYEYARSIVLNEFEDVRFLPILYHLNDRNTWTDPKHWAEANPGLGTIKSCTQLSDDVQKARNDPSYLPTLLVKDFNVLENAGAAWLPFDAVNNTECASMDYLRKSYAIGGCDLSATTDLTCATLLIRKPKDDNVYILQQYFLPKSRVDALTQRGGKQEAPYKLWADQGWLTLCNGAAVDFHEVTAWFIRMVKEFNIRPLWICYDAALSGYWVPEMVEYGFEMEKIRQGPFTWTYPMKEMGAALMDHRVIYQNNPILKMCLLNTAKKSTNRDGIESIQPVKSQQNRRIDGAVSMLNAWVGYCKHIEEYLPYVR